MRSGLLFLVCTVLSCRMAAGASLYAINEEMGTPFVYVLDSTTMAVTKTITSLSGFNGLGVAVIGSTLYYSDRGDKSIYSYNLSTNTNTGKAFTTADFTAAIASDGTNLWLTNGSGTGYLYSPGGTLLKTITLSGCTFNCDGLEYFVDTMGHPRLIQSEGAPNFSIYDLYDTNGNLLTHNYVTTTGSSGGTAYDGTNYFVVANTLNAIGVYNSAGVLLRNQTITGFPAGLTPDVADLSFDYAQVLTPEPSTATTIGVGLLCLLAAARLRKSS